MLTRVPYYFGDLNGNPNLANYPYSIRVNMRLVLQWFKDQLLGLIGLVAGLFMVLYLG